MVTCKMRCVQLREIHANPANQKVVSLQAVAGPGNESWSKWTPSGTMELTITNPAALEQFKVGAEYLVNFEAVAAPAG